MTFVSRVRVTGGFLAGLDLQFEPGLNVVVGPRGAGKTTLLELMRHALALSDGTQSSDRASFLRQVLGSGEVVLDLNTPRGAERLVVDADGAGSRPDLTAELALMLGQNELEEIADSPRRRLALVDLRAGLSVNPQQQELLEELKKLTIKAKRLRETQEGLQDQLRKKSSLLDDREKLRGREAELLARNTNSLGAQRETLALIEREILTSTSELRGAEQVLGARHRLTEILAPLGEVLGDIESAQLETSVREDVHRLVNSLKAHVNALDKAAAKLEDIAVRSHERLRLHDAHLRAKAEPVRTRLDQAEKGLGAVTAGLRDLETQLHRLVSVEVELRHCQIQEQGTLIQRQRIQDLLENSTEQLFRARDRAARSITGKLQHRVQISIRHLADASTFRRVLSELLHGSGLKYNQVSETISNSVPPFALVKYVEQADALGLSEAALLSPDRAYRVIATLAQGDALARIVAIPLDDAADFSLQDGATLKPAAVLSTGQKCAITMPIVLTDEERIVILDQPEDHLDNQFLVDRIVSRLIARSAAGAQTIVATHNPNIPVLGGAGMVVSLVSDGTHGGVAAQGPFDSSTIVNVITSLMEGGRQAFERRAEFYATHRGQ